MTLEDYNKYDKEFWDIVIECVGSNESKQTALNKLELAYKKYEVSEDTLRALVRKKGFDTETLAHNISFFTWGMDNLYKKCKGEIEALPDTAIGTGGTQAPQTPDTTQALQVTPIALKEICELCPNIDTIGNGKPKIKCSIPDFVSWLIENRYVSEKKADKKKDEVTPNFIFVNFETRAKKLETIEKAFRDAKE